MPGGVGGGEIAEGGVATAAEPVGSGVAAGPVANSVLSPMRREMVIRENFTILISF